MATDDPAIRAKRNLYGMAALLLLLGVGVFLFVPILGVILVVAAGAAWMYGAWISGRYGA